MAEEFDYDFNCDGCVHYEFGWGACEFEPDPDFREAEGVFNPHYDGTECERYKEKEKKEEEEILVMDYLLHARSIK